MLRLWRGACQRRQAVAPDLLRLLAHCRRVSWWRAFGHAAAVGAWDMDTRHEYRARGDTLMQFVAEGRQYAEMYFDPDLIMETGGSFTGARTHVG